MEVCILGGFRAEGLKSGMDMIHGGGAGIVHMSLSTPCIARTPLVTSEDFQCWLYICTVVLLHWQPRNVDLYPTTCPLRWHKISQLWGRLVFRLVTKLLSGN
jgi:hypothetical protein